MEDARRRLGWVALVYALGYLIAFFGPHLFGVATGVRTLGNFLARPIWVAVLSIASGLLVYGAARSRAVSTSRVLDLGLVFYVLGALGIAYAEIWETTALYAPGEFMGVSWVAVWLVVFPSAVPSPPRKVLVAALLGASTTPLVLWGSTQAGVTRWEGYGFTEGALYFAFSTYLCAVIAWAVSRIIHDYEEQLREALSVGSYRLLEPLGEGGMGEVWRAEHRLLAKPAAVKLIGPEFLQGGGRGATRRFEREAQATALLRSVHTVELYDFGVAPDGRFFYVMELLDGLNLERLVLDYGPQPPGRVVHILRQACRSLEEAHARGLIHRDIKPANIYVCRFGSDVDFVKLLDFGLVKTDPAHEDTNLTGQGVIAGTPAYAAPEMLRSTRLDGRADLYSLGCVGYWLLTGTPVFQSDSAVALIVDHAKVPPEPPSRRVGGPVPDDLERVILRCLAKNPDERYQSAAELDRALAECASGPSWHRGEALAWWRMHMPPADVSPPGQAAETSPAPRETFSRRDAS